MPHDWSTSKARNKLVRAIKSEMEQTRSVGEYVDRFIETRNASVEALHTAINSVVEAAKAFTTSAQILGLAVPEFYPEVQEHVCGRAARIMEAVETLHTVFPLSCGDPPSELMTLMERFGSSSAPAPTLLDLVENPDDNPTHGFRLFDSLEEMRAKHNPLKNVSASQLVASLEGLVKGKDVG